MLINRRNSSGKFTRLFLRVLNRFFVPILRVKCRLPMEVLGAIGKCANGLFLRHLRCFLFHFTVFSSVFRVIPRLSIRGEPRTNVVLPSKLRSFQKRVSRVFRLVRHRAMLPKCLPNSVAPILSFPFMKTFPRPMTLTIASSATTNARAYLNGFLLCVRLIFYGVRDFLSDFKYFYAMAFVCVYLFFIGRLIPSVR